MSNFNNHPPQLHSPSTSNKLPVLPTASAHQQHQQQSFQLQSLFTPPPAPRRKKRERVWETPSTSARVELDQVLKNVQNEISTTHLVVSPQSQPLQIGNLSASHSTIDNNAIQNSSISALLLHFDDNDVDLLNQIGSNEMEYFPTLTQQRELGQNTQYYENDNNFTQEHNVNITSTFSNVQNSNNLILDTQWPALDIANISLQQPIQQQQQQQTPFIGRDDLKVPRKNKGKLNGFLDENVNIVGEGITKFQNQMSCDPRKQLDVAQSLEFDLSDVHQESITKLPTSPEQTNNNKRRLTNYDLRDGDIIEQGRQKFQRREGQFGMSEIAMKRDSSVINTLNVSSSAETNAASSLGLGKNPYSDDVTLTPLHIPGRKVTVDDVVNRPIINRNYKKRMGSKLSKQNEKESQNNLTTNMNSNLRNSCRNNTTSDFLNTNTMNSINTSNPNNYIENGFSLNKFDSTVTINNSNNLDGENKLINQKNTNNIYVPKDKNNAKTRNNENFTRKINKAIKLNKSSIKNGSINNNSNNNINNRNRNRNRNHNHNHNHNHNQNHNYDNKSNRKRNNNDKKNHDKNSNNNSNENYSSSCTDIISVSGEDDIPISDWAIPQKRKRSVNSDRENSAKENSILCQSSGRHGCSKGRTSVDERLTNPEKGDTEKSRHHGRRQACGHSRNNVRHKSEHVKRLSKRKEEEYMDSVSQVQSNENSKNDIERHPRFSTQGQRGRKNAVHNDEKLNSVTMWNNVSGFKMSGNSAPQRRNLEAYLKAYPDREVYKNQDEELWRPELWRMYTGNGDRVKLANGRLFMFNKNTGKYIGGNCVPLFAKTEAYLKKNPHIEARTAKKTDEKAEVLEELDMTDFETEASTKLLFGQGKHDNIFDVPLTLRDEYPSPSNDIEQYLREDEQRE